MLASFNEMKKVVHNNDFKQLYENMLLLI